MAAAATPVAAAEAAAVVTAASAGELGTLALLLTLAVLLPAAVCCGRIVSGGRPPRGEAGRAAPLTLVPLLAAVAVAGTRCGGRCGEGPPLRARIAGRAARARRSLTGGHRRLRSAGGPAESGVPAHAMIFGDAHPRWPAGSKYWRSHARRRPIPESALSAS